MLHDAPQFLIALEQSGLGALIRSSPWAYPVANVGHIVALTLFAASVAIMDLRLLGAFAATAPAAIVRPARRGAMLGLGLMAVTGFMLFTAEASHVAMNGVFQLKAVLIALGILNALLIAGPAFADIAEVPPNTSLPARVRAAAAISLLIWISVAACGRLIAYF
ncbi:MAG: hypothetical protein HC868_10115 [Sphingomonadales bacterium]|nr:hypothetical protein [Sphingomonadales bacterium]